MPLLRAFALTVISALAVSLPRAQSIVATVPGAGGLDVAVDAGLNRVYTAGGYSNRVAVVDGASNSVTQVTVGYRPQFIAVNPVTHRVYASNTQDGTLSVIDAATLAVVNLPIGGAGPIAINERTNKIYVMRRGNNGEVTVVDGASNTWYSITTASYVPEWMVVNPGTNKLYVSHSTSGDVRAIDASSASDHPPTVGILVAGRPSYIALNSATNKVYVLSDDARGPIVAIDGATNASQRITTPGHSGAPVSIAVNPATNRIYAALGNEVVVVDGFTNAAVGYIPTGFLSHLTVDAGLNRIYGVSGNTAVLVVDGATNTFTRLATEAYAVAVNPVTHRAYVAGGGLAVIDPGASAPSPAAYGINAQGMWWAAPAGVESGWGLNIAHQGNTIFATWFTYDADGSAMWLVMPNGARTAASSNAYAGEVYRTTGPSLGTPFDPAKVSTSAVGTASVSLLDADRAVFSATVFGKQVDKDITRQVYAAPMPVCAVGASPGAQANYQDMWWASPAGSQSGWGVNLAHEGDILFLTWFTYGPDGKALWLVGSNVARTGNNTYSGTLYRTWGPPYGAQPWNRSLVSMMPVGSVTVAFSDAANGTFSYTAMGVSGSVQITRQVFSSPATACR